MREKQFDNNVIEEFDIERFRQELRSETYNFNEQHPNENNFDSLDVIKESRVGIGRLGFALLIVPLNIIGSKLVLEEIVGSFLLSLLFLLFEYLLVESRLYNIGFKKLSKATSLCLTVIPMFFVFMALFNIDSVFLIFLICIFYPIRNISLIFLRKDCGRNLEKKYLSMKKLRQLRRVEKKLKSRLDIQEEITDIQNRIEILRKKENP